MYLYVRVCVGVCVCVCVCVCSERERERERERRNDLNMTRKYVEKVKQKKYVWWFVYFPTRFDFNIFFWMHKYFIKIILVLEIIMIDQFWFIWKSSSGLVDLAIWKKLINTSWYVMECFE